MEHKYNILREQKFHINISYKCLPFNLVTLHMNSLYDALLCKIVLVSDSTILHYLLLHTV